MATPARPRDTYRKHSKARALDQARPHLVRRILDEIGKRNLSANAITRLTRIDIDASRLWALRESYLDEFSDNRLLLLGERLGVAVSITVH